MNPESKHKVLRSTGYEPGIKAPSQAPSQASSPHVLEVPVMNTGIKAPSTHVLEGRAAQIYKNAQNRCS